MREESSDKSPDTPEILVLLRMRDLQSRYGLVPATVYRWIGEGSFPVPVNIGENSVAWHLEEIEQWRWSRPRAKVKQIKRPET
jgi:prophage regulatory protein